MSEANDLIMGTGGPPAAKFPTIGTLVRGTITNTDTTQQRDYLTKKLLFWSSDNRPTTDPTDRKMMQAVITVQTDQRDDQDDDGLRRIYISGQNMRDVVRDAVLAAGVKQIEVGGTLAVQYVSGAGVTGDPKQYAAEYKAPAIGVGLLNNDAPTEAQTQRPTSLLAG